jgi:hypothetical protein
MSTSTVAVLAIRVCADANLSRCPRLRKRIGSTGTSIPPTTTCWAPAASDITLVEYGSYACPYCRAANEEIARLRDRFGDPLALRVPATADHRQRHRAARGRHRRIRAGRRVFWDAHVKLMTRSATLTEDDLASVADQVRRRRGHRTRRPGHAAVDADISSARASGVHVTPTFFINGRRYDGPWDRCPLSEALLGSLGHRVHSAAVDFASWAPPPGVLLLAMSILAVLIVNSPLGPAFSAFWEAPLGIEFAGRALSHAALALGERRLAHDLLSFSSVSRSSANSPSAGSPTGASPPFPSRLRSAAWRCPPRCTHS